MNLYLTRTPRRARNRPTYKEERCRPRKFGVSASAAVMQAPAGGAGDGAAEAEAEKLKADIEEAAASLS
jgi:hypothetical protein